MRKPLIGVVCLLLLGSGAFLALPWITEAMLLWQCSEAKSGETCVTRMRVMGHVWSRRGDTARAQSWYERAARGGDPQAMFHLAWIHALAALEDTRKQLRQMAEGPVRRDGGRWRTSVTSDKGRSHFELAKEWYGRSAALGFAPAMNNLGQIYLFGFGALLDYGRAFDLHMAAAEAGNPVARWNVAIAFSDGFGVDANPVEADNWRTWTPPEGITPDLMEPTLARTLLFGSTLSETERANLRRATELGEPVTMTTRPKSVSPYSTNFPIVAPKLQD